MQASTLQTAMWHGRWRAATRGRRNQACCRGWAPSISGRSPGLRSPRTAPATWALETPTYRRAVAAASRDSPLSPCPTIPRCRPGKAGPAGAPSSSGGVAGAAPAEVAARCRPGLAVFVAFIFVGWPFLRHNNLVPGFIWRVIAVAGGGPAQCLWVAGEPAWCLLLLAPRTPLVRSAYARSVSRSPSCYHRLSGLNRGAPAAPTPLPPASPSPPRPKASPNSATPSSPSAAGATSTATCRASWCALS
jgi:hypothetical protein